MNSAGSFRDGSTAYCYEKRERTKYCISAQRFFPDISRHFHERSQDIIQLKTSVETGKRDINCLDLVIGNPDISGHFRTFAKLRAVTLRIVLEPRSAG